MNSNLFKLRTKNIAWLIVAAIFFMVDRYLKDLSISSWPSSPKKLVGNLLSFDFVPNYKIAFSLPLGGLGLNILIAVIIICIVLYIFLNKGRLTQLEILAYIGIVLGALSNLADRLKYGYVIDYLDLRWFTVFNLADVLISAGTLFLIIHILAETKKGS